MLLRLLQREKPREFLKNPKGYLYRAAVNLSLTILQTRRRREFTEASVDPAPAGLVAAEPSPEQLVLNAERHHRLQQAIRGLPPRLREPLQLWHSGRYTYDEMAQIAAVRIGTIKSRVREARRAAVSNYACSVRNLATR